MIGIGGLTGKHPRRLMNVIEVALGKEMLLYSPESETAFSVNHSAKAIWELCDGRSTVGEISQELGRRFGCSGDELLSDVIDATIQLSGLRLLELEDTPRTVRT